MPRYPFAKIRHQLSLAIAQHARTNDGADMPPEREILVKLSREECEAIIDRTRDTLLDAGDRIAGAVDRLVVLGTISSRSPAADALLDYAETRHPDAEHPIGAVAARYAEITARLEAPGPAARKARRRALPRAPGLAEPGS